MAMVSWESERLARRPRQPPPPLTAARAREQAPDSTRATAQASRITMADVTEQTPLAATEPRPKSIKRLVISSAAISLALGFAAVSAVDHGLVSFSSSLPYVQIKLDDMGVTSSGD